MGGNLEIVFQHHVGLRESDGHAPPFQRQHLAEGQIAAGVDGDGVGCQRGLRRGVVGQGRAFDANQFQRGAGGVQVVGGHRSHLVANEPDAGVEDGQVGGQPSRWHVEGR